MNAHPHRRDLKLPLRSFVICICLSSFPQLVGAQDAKVESVPDSDLPTVDEVLKVPRRTPTKPDGKAIDRPVEEEASTEPFEQAVEGMRQAATRLSGEQDAGIETQRIQEQVVKRLDMLLSQMRKQQMQQRSKARQQDTGSQQQSQSQQRQEQSAQAAVNESDPNAAKRQQPKTEQLADQPYQEQMVEWGKLPERLRQALHNVNPDQYSSLYRDLTERYYRRLAEESQ
jgi:hypothetical protein